MSHLISHLTRARTKIIATLGPASRKPEQILELVRAGADLFRINMAHGSLADHEASAAAVRQVSRELNWPIGILIDLAGPKIRVGELPGGQVDCPMNAEFRFIRGEVATKPNELAATYARLVDELRVGDTVLLVDGAVSMLVEEVTAECARCRVIGPGVVKSHQGLNLPGVKLSAPAMDEEDRVNAAWAAKNGIDYIGLSFVRAASDILELKALLREHNSHARVIAKIEKPEALEQLDAIITAADGIMVARGDLGVEIDVARMPLVQKQIVSACHKHQKPVIIATQMLDSMQHSRRPTRAEVTDVANAILDGGDACMLSGETAVGDYPRDAVEMMNRVALATEELFHKRPLLPPGEILADGLHHTTAAVVYGAGVIASQLGARLIAVASHTGATALALSKQRNYVPTVGVSDLESTLRLMCLYWGVIPLFGAPLGSSSELLQFVSQWGLSDGSVAPGDRMVLVAGIGLTAESHNVLVVHQVP